MNSKQEAANATTHRTAFTSRVVVVVVVVVSIILLVQDVEPL